MRALQALCTFLALLFWYFAGEFAGANHGLPWWAFILQGMIMFVVTVLLIGLPAIVTYIKLMR